MGLMKFLVPCPERLPSEALERAYMSASGDAPWRTRMTLTDGVLQVDRAENDSGNLTILWRVGPRGELALSTATLMQRAEPYHLPVELARGTLHRLRNHLWAWEMIGMTVPASVRAGLHAAIGHFTRAATSQQDVAAAALAANEAIDAAVVTIETLTRSYADQVARVRQKQPRASQLLLSGSLGQRLPAEALAATFTSAFNSATVPLCWGEVESHEGKHQWSLSDSQIAWCEAHGLRIVGGPLLELDKRSIPDWLYLWEEDFENLLAMAGEYVRTIVTRYKGRVHLWHCAARINTGDAISLTEEQQLRLAVRSVEVARSVDGRSPLIVSFDQPWGEYMNRRGRDLSPLHFADALARADVGISGIGLEVSLGADGGSTLPRDPLEFNYHLERWSTLGIPLIMMLSVPSTGSGFGPQAQKRWIETFVPLMLTKQGVQGIFWRPLFDGQSNQQPSGGLFDGAGRAKPALSAMAAIKQFYQA